jgi:predicted PurR-regulated permease PerM
VWRFLGWAAVIAAALYFLYIVRASLIPFLIGGVIALLLNPFVDALCRRGYSRGRAILNVFHGVPAVHAGAGVDARARLLRPIARDYSNI